MPQHFPLNFMLGQTHDRELAYRAIINRALKDNRKYCNYCGKAYDPKRMPCCESPEIGTNAQHAWAVAKQCRLIRETRDKETAATKDNSMRWGVSLPPWMYEMLDNYEKLHDRRLISSQADVNWLAKTFKTFAIPRKV